MPNTDFMTTFAIGVELTTITCNEPGCGITFGVPVDWVAARKRDHATWTCPNSHQRIFAGKSQEEKLRDQLAAAQKMAAYERTRRENVEDRNTNLTRSNRALKGVATKLKKRVANGTCPFCEHSFLDVATHVEAEHPAELAAANAEADEPEATP